MSALVQTGYMGKLYGARCKFFRYIKVGMNMVNEDLRAPVQSSLM